MAEMLRVGQKTGVEEEQVEQEERREGRHHRSAVQDRLLLTTLQ